MRGVGLARVKGEDMHPTSAEPFAETLEKTGVWLQELAQDLGNTTPHRAYSVLRAVLTSGELNHVRDQLPRELLSLWYLPNLA